MSNIVTGIAQRKIIGSGTKKAVFMLISACASDDGTGVWVSKQNMANDLEVSKRAVQLAIKDFLASGLIEEQGRRPCKNGYTYEYNVNLEALSALKSTREHHSPVNTIHPTGEHHSPQDVNTIHPNSPLTIHEPKSTPCIPQIKKPDKARIPEEWVPSPEDYEYAHSLKLHDDDIEEIANDFHIYWSDRTDANGRKSARGWKQTWRNRCRDVAPKFIRNRNMAGGAGSFGHGQGGGIAGAVARRRANR